MYAVYTQLINFPFIITLLRELRRIVIKVTALPLFHKKFKENLKKKQNMKTQGSKKQSDPPCNRFTTVLLKQTCVCKLIEPLLYSAASAISSVHYVHKDLNTAHCVNWS